MYPNIDVELHIVVGLVYIQKVQANYHGPFWTWTQNGDAQRVVSLKSHHSYFPEISYISWFISLYFLSEYFTSVL